ncbi:ANTAR domain-containing protein [Streptomyces abyssalis]|uniref:ANTAR domain-containing protein n=1 Tax=Streptomyces abyssalis TaxID=933944 RepID=UPI00085C4502|nr:ANTAR domain-containing protein [Streptomyces abyssalis]
MGEAENPHAELEQLRRAMETRPVIDQAHGVLMAVYRCTPDDAWNVLVTVSQHTNTKLHQVATALVESTQGSSLPESLSSALRAALPAPSPDQTGQGA